MPWSRDRVHLLHRLVPSLRGRLDIHCTAYGPSRFRSHLHGRGWLTFDGVEIVTVDATFLGLCSAQFRCCAHPIVGGTLADAARSLPRAPIADALNSGDTALRALAL